MITITMTHNGPKHICRVDDTLAMKRVLDTEDTHQHIEFIRCSTYLKHTLAPFLSYAHLEWNKERLHLVVLGEAVAIAVMRPRFFFNAEEIEVEITGAIKRFVWGMFN